MFTFKVQTELLKNNFSFFNSKTNTHKTNGVSQHEREIETYKIETINECSNDTFAWSIKSLYADGKCQWIECEQKFEDIDTFKKLLFCWM